MDAKKLIRWILDLKGTNIWMNVLSPGATDTGPQWACGGDDQLPDPRFWIRQFRLSAGRGLPRLERWPLVMRRQRRP